MAITPWDYIRLRREAAGLSIEDVASIIKTEPHVDELGRAAWLRNIEAGTAPIGTVEMNVLRAAFPFSPMVLNQLADHHASPATTRAPRLCRVCACSDADACVDENRVACAWIAEDLCSAHGPDEADGAQAVPIDDEDESAAPSPDADADEAPERVQRSNAYFSGLLGERAA